MVFGGARAGGEGNSSGGPKFIDYDVVCSEKSPAFCKIIVLTDDGQIIEKIIDYDIAQILIFKK